MNRDETVQLLKLRLEMTGKNFAAGMLDTWADLLSDVDPGEAFVAMRRACTSHADVQWFQFHQELEAHRVAKGDPRDFEPRPVCPLCDGSGWREAPDLISERTYGLGPNAGQAIRYTQVQPCSCR